MNEILTPILARLTRGAELSSDEIDAATGEIFEGRVSDVQAAGFIVALRTKGETADELAALVRAMHRFATPVKVADGAIDTCGTGGDRSGTVNVSTMAALIAAGAGARREARQPGAVFAGGIGRRVRGARRRDRPRARGCRALRRGGRRRLLLRAAVPPGDALSRAGPQGARRAHHVQLPRSAGQPGACGARP